VSDDDPTQNARSWFERITHALVITRDLSLATFSIAVMLIIDLVSRLFEL